MKSITWFGNTEMRENLSFFHIFNENQKIYFFKLFSKLILLDLDGYVYAVIVIQRGT